MRGCVPVGGDLDLQLRGFLLAVHDGSVRVGSLNLVNTMTSQEARIAGGEFTSSSSSIPVVKQQLAHCPAKPGPECPTYRIRSTARQTPRWYN